MAGFIVGLYGFFAFVAFLNLSLMRRPRKSGHEFPAILIPARNEEENLRRLIPVLVGQGAKVYVGDDSSEDHTYRVAQEGGARAIGIPELPEGWTGKNWACHHLAQAAAEDFSGEWILFLDADVHPEPDFMAKFAGLIEDRGGACPVITGFPRFIPGRGLEPGYLSWMTWILLSTNPFGLVSRTGFGHNLFTNGQVTAWRQSVYWQVEPHSQCRGDVLEDVKIGRLLGKTGKRVETAELSGILGVQMYGLLEHAWRGMLKNSAEIAGRGVGSWILGLLLIGLGWAWLLAENGIWLALFLLALSRLLTLPIVRHPIWTALVMPLSLTAGGWTILASSIQRGRKGVEWKGRTYLDR